MDFGSSVAGWLRFCHAYGVSSPTPEMEPKPKRGMPDRVRNDGRAAIAITVLAALLIAFLINRLM
jgi:hypothetical protein